MAGPDPATTEWVPIWNSMSAGPVGPTGPQGNPGEKWFTGAGVPSGSLAGSIVGDWYLDSTNGDYYEKTGATTWTLRGNLKGPQGIQGIQGPQGIQGIQGNTGTPGEKWFAGSGVPAGSLAGSIVGDWYLDTVSGDVYEKTGASTWTVRANIKGPQGIQGIQGIQGPIGNTGPPGSTTPHSPNHQIGGSDVLLNNAWTNQANTFTQGQEIQTNFAPSLYIRDTSQAVDQRLFKVQNAAGVLYLSAVNDANTTQSGACILNRSGDWQVGRDIYEKGRSAAIGHWTDVAFNAANFGATGGTLSGVSQAFFHYMFIGKTMWLSVGFSGTITGTPSTLNVVLPLGFTIAKYSVGTSLILNAGIYGIGHIQCVPPNYFIGIQTSNAANWTAGSVMGYFTIPVIV